MLKTTIWKPDTCDCELEYEWDTESREDERVHTVKTILKTCEAHKDSKDMFDQYDKVVEENQRKNKVLAEVMAADSSLVETSLDDRGDSVTQLKRGVNYNWSFDNDRTLHVSFSGTATPSLSSITALNQTMDEKFGLGRVVVE